LAISCPKCSHQIQAASFNKPPEACPGCGSEISVAAFASLISGPSDSGAGERILISDQASCFYHPNKKATVPCENCGRFLCALCNVDFGGKSLCPACIEGGQHDDAQNNTDATRILWDKLAIFLAIVPTILTQLIALFLTLRYWSSPISIPPRHRLRWRWILAVIIAFLELWFFYVLIFEGF
jgi:hypothetical protein